LNKYKPNIKSYDWQNLLKQYTSIVNYHQNVIEIGASNITRTKQLAKYCHRLTGIEYYPKRIPINTKNITYQQGDWQNLKKIKSNYYDLLVSSHTIEHIKNDLNAINETYRILKKGGVALITTPNRLRLIRILIESFIGKKTFPYKEHQREYSYSDLQLLLSNSNFKKYQIMPIGIGVYGGGIKLISKKVPKILNKYSCFWLIILKK